MSGHRPTLQSVADRAQVSRQTVSNAINSPERLHPETLGRVRAAIESLRYRPHRAARSLRTRRSHLIGVRLMASGDGISGVVVDRFVHRLAEAADARGFRVVVFTAAEDRAEIEAYDDLLTTLDLDALVLTGTHHGDGRTDWLADRAVPFVTFGRPWGATARHSWVDVDGALGVQRVTADLIAAGQRRVAFLGWPQGSGVGDDRRSGWAAAMGAAAEPADGLSAQRLDGVDSGRDGMQTLLASTSPPNAVVCASDSLALGALQALEQAGRSAGPEFPVIGFDDTPVAAAVGLSSIAQPLRESAAECLRLLTALLDSARQRTPPARVLLEPTLVVRATGGVHPSTNRHPAVQQRSHPRSSST
ncbi:MAG: substrate-binding domain-containing protein [Mycobacteriales bacterium]